MFFKPLCKGSCWLSNIFFITFHPVTLISVDDSTFVEDVVFIHGSHQAWWYGTIMLGFRLLCCVGLDWSLLLLLLWLDVSCLFSFTLLPMLDIYISLQFGLSIFLLSVDVGEWNRWCLLCGIVYLPHCTWMVCCDGCPNIDTCQFGWAFCKQ